MLNAKEQYKDFGSEAQHEPVSSNVNVCEDNQKKYPYGVEKGFVPTVESCFDVLLKERGWTWADAYNKIDLHKSHASLIRRGLVIPPLWLRIKIAKVFDVDTSVIWRTPIVISADQMEENKNVA